MQLDADNLLVGAVFLAQVVVLSFVTPGIIRRTYRLLFERYPADQYARLYPVPKAEMERQLDTYMSANRLIGGAGLLVIVVVLWAVQRPLQAAMTMTVFSMLQLVPGLMRARWQRRHLRELAKLAPPTKRKAELRKWRVPDFVAPWFVGLSISATAIALGCAVLLGRTAPHTRPIDVYSGVISAVLLAWMLRTLLLPLRLPRPDPYMSASDLFQVRGRRIRLLFRGALVMSVYLTFTMLYSAGMIRFDYIYMPIAVSVLYQFLSLRLGTVTLRMLDSRDFSVYRASTVQPGERVTAAIE